MPHSSLPLEADLIHGPSWPWYDSPALERAQALVSKGRVFDYGHGPELSELEDLASTMHARSYCVALNSGSSALLAAFVSLGIGPGDEVVLPTFTFATCASPLLLLGAVPVLADSGAPNGNVTLESVRPHVTSRTRAVLVTHLFGDPVDLEPIVAWTAPQGIATIEDCSHAHGSRHSDGMAVGTKADIAIFSIGGVKTVSGGLGGLLLTNDETTHDLTCLLSSFKQRSRLTVRQPELRRLSEVGLGGNLRISPIAAVLATSHLHTLREIVKEKQRNSDLLESRLSALPGLTRVPHSPGADLGGRYGVHLVLGADSPPLPRNELVAMLAQSGLRITEPKTQLLHRSAIFSGVRPPRSPYPDHLWKQHFSFSPHDFPIASRLHDSWLAMPADYLYGREGGLADFYLERVTEVWENAS
jgi:perosamine synthetase